MTLELALSLDQRIEPFLAIPPGSKKEMGYQTWIDEYQNYQMSHLYRVVFLTGPPDFQYQNEKQVAANQDNIFKKFLCKKAHRWLSKFFFHFGTENGEEQLKKSTL